MIAFVSLISIVLFTLLLGSLFRGQHKENHLTSCLSMFVAMTKSTLIGILVALWIPDIVFSTIIAILLSFLFISIMTYQLATKIVLECLSALFMGSMMGTMLSLMTTENEIISLLFFTSLYLISCIISAGLWNKDHVQNFFKGIPTKVTITSLLIVILLAFTTVVDLLSLTTSEVEREHHEHHE
ncbi:hypothetical protein [Ureibacillus sp. FSL E2-3493]|uniref:hypothetical protein n=1 Tax=Ureibacillus sp. FSL E2-3493 TaxID=2921367 RepID=UPI00311A1277